MSALPKFTMKQLLDAGVHFGHKTMRWNPAMAPYIFGERNQIHIIDLQKTVPMLHKALEAVRDVAANNGRILFVSTKRQSSRIVAEAAKRCGQYYVNHRWLGGMMTNWNTISQSIKTLRDLQAQLEDDDVTLNKKERLYISRKVEKLEKALGGIKDMGGVPDLIFVIDINKENIAILEANKLGIPVVAIADTNTNPQGVSYPVPGNDDAIRSIELYCNLIADSILAGLEASIGKTPANKDEKPEDQNTPAEELKSAVKGKDAEKASAEKKKPAKKAEAKKETADDVPAAETDEATKKTGTEG